MQMVIYASPRPSVLGSELGELQISAPWCMLGNFNVVLSSEERLPVGKPLVYFQELVSKRGFIDLGYNGHCFTWSHGSDVQQRRSARLDRVLWTRIGRAPTQMQESHIAHMLTLICYAFN